MFLRLGDSKTTHPSVVAGCTRILFVSPGSWFPILCSNQSVVLSLRRQSDTPQTKKTGSFAIQITPPIASAAVARNVCGSKADARRHNVFILHLAYPAHAPRLQLTQVLFYRHLLHVSWSWLSSPTNAYLRVRVGAYLLDEVLFLTDAHDTKTCLEYLMVRALLRHNRNWYFGACIGCASSTTSHIPRRAGD